MNFAEFLGGAAMPVLADCLRQMDRGGDGPRQGWLICLPKLPATSPPAVSAWALPWNHGVFVCSSRSHDSEFLLPLVPRGRRRLCGVRFQVVRVLRGTPDRHMARWSSSMGVVRPTCSPQSEICAGLGSWLLALRRRSRLDRPGIAMRQIQPHRIHSLLKNPISASPATEIRDRG